VQALHPILPGRVAATRRPSSLITGGGRAPYGGRREGY
jgi:hypothetical protein